jgi:VanZ family protein
MRIQFPKWLPALLMMLVIFWFSSRPGSEPLFGWVEFLIKKAGHMIGYALLALSYWRAFDFKVEKRWIAWLLAVLYALTDEFHQAFVPGRHPSIWDIVIFDNIGALIALGIAARYRKRKRPDSMRSVIEKTYR